MPLTSGVQLGPYQILSLHGARGMGELYRGRDPRFDRDVAIWVLPLSAIPDSVFRPRVGEAQPVPRLEHPNIPTIYDFGAHCDAPYIVSEWLDGQTLRERLSKGPIPARTALGNAVQIAQGLAAAHRKAVVHGDLKPENVFVTMDGRIKILEFELRVLDRERAIHYRTDIFAVGVVLYEMLTGRYPFARQRAPEMTPILRNELPDLRRAGPHVFPALEQVLRRCLDNNPARRFHTAQELGVALSEIQATLNGG